MKFQTIFYHRPTGQILNVLPSKYIRSKAEKQKYCPGYPAEETSMIYFPSDLPVDPDIMFVKWMGKSDPAQLMDTSGIPLICLSKKMPFLHAIEQFSTIIVDMVDSMGDNLYRAAAVIEAQKVFPSIPFYCNVEARYVDVLKLIPEITLFTSHKQLGLDPKKCGTVKMPAAFFNDPKGNLFSAPSGYGFYLALPHVPYTVKLTIPPGYDDGFASFDSTIGLRADGHNVVFQLRTKTDEGRSWDIPKAVELARLIHEAYDCTVFYLGSDNDLSGDQPGLINLTNKTTWLQTIHLLRSASHIFCIDSSVLHLCHALDVQAFRLWGRTCPAGVLGEAPGAFDIFSSYSSTQSDIKAISPEQVFFHAFGVRQVTESFVFDHAHDYSQHGDQEVIFKYFSEHPPTNRLLVDVGAFGKHISNSFGLLEQGWKGLLIEPSPGRVKIIKQEFAGLDVTVLNIGISDQRGKLPFYPHKSGEGSSFLPDWFPDDKLKKTISVEVFPLTDVLLEQNLPTGFDLLLVDAEGLDEKIMVRFFEDGKFSPWLIVCECTSFLDANGLFNKHGYTLIARTGERPHGNFFFSRDR